MASGLGAFNTLFGPLQEDLLSEGVGRNRLESFNFSLVVNFG